MTYYISRKGETSGPYSLIDLQRYVASGEIAPGDLARGEGMPNWVPVSQILSGAGGSSFEAAGALPAGGYPAPPDLHWGLVLLFGLLTCGVFMWVWMFIEAAYVSKIDRGNRSMLLYAIGVPCLLIFSVVRGIEAMTDTWLLSGSIYLGGVVLTILGHFKMRASLEDHFNRVEPIHLRLSGVMTFFFNVLYFQYHFNRINRWKRTGVLQ